MPVKYYLRRPEGTHQIDGADDADARRRAGNVMAANPGEGELTKVYFRAFHGGIVQPTVQTTIEVYHAPEHECWRVHPGTESCHLGQTTASDRLWAHAHATEDRAMTAEAAGKSGVDLRRVAVNIGEVALMAANDGECFLVRSGVRV